MKYGHTGRFMYHVLASVMLVWLGASGCRRASSESDGSPRRLTANQRYQVQLAERLRPLDPAPIKDVAQSEGWWLRIGHEPDVSYYHGATQCQECDYHLEKDFFRGSRVYLDPLDSTLAAYVQSEQGEVILLGNTAGTEVFFVPYTELGIADAVEQIRTTLERLGYQGVPAAGITLRGLPNERLMQ